MCPLLPPFFLRNNGAPIIFETQGTKTDFDER